MEPPPPCVQPFCEVPPEWRLDLAVRPHPSGPLDLQDLVVHSCGGHLQTFLLWYRCHLEEREGWWVSPLGDPGV